MSHAATIASMSTMRESVGKPVKWTPERVCGMDAMQAQRGLPMDRGTFAFGLQRHTAYPVFARKQEKQRPPLAHTHTH